MDEFYRHESLDVFKLWVYLQIKSDPRLTLEIIDDETYQISYKDKVATFTLWHIGIVEEEVKQGNKILFYLHFQFHQYHYAVDLFKRMMDKLLEDTTDDCKKVLLCCSGGMTTGYFSEKMNQYCQYNHLNYKINATALYHLKDVYEDYDMILVAPQLRYKVLELMREYQPLIVKSIDPITFATYDCQLLMNQIEKELSHE